MGAHLFEDPVIEELLQLLVAVVDAELLKTVDLIILWKNAESEMSQGRLGGKNGWSDK